MAESLNGPFDPPDRGAGAFLNPDAVVGGQDAAPYSADQSGPGFYPDFVTRSVYLGNTGLLQTPVAGPLGTSARVVRRSAPYAQRVVYWKAQRLVSKPTLPHWDTSNANEVLAAFVIAPHEPVLLAGGENYYFVVEGLYRYFLYAVPCMTDDFYACVTALFTATAEDMKVQGYQFSRELLRSKPPAKYTGTDDQKFLTGDGGGHLQDGLYPGP